MSEENKLYVLMMNDMRFAKIELVAPVAKAKYATEIVSFLNEQSTTYYRDGGWCKSYRKGGPLEWFNTPSNIDQHIRQVDACDVSSVPLIADLVAGEEE